MMDKTPYYFQELAVKSTMNSLAKCKDVNPLIVAPTGSGKTHIIAKLCKSILEKDFSVDIIILAHIGSILEQNRKTIQSYFPKQTIGLYSAGLKSKTIDKITVAGIQSIYKKAHLFKEKTIVIIDEAHLVPFEGDGRFLTFLQAFDPAKLLFVIGLTATPFRLGKGLLTDSDHVFDKIVYQIDILTLVREGYLSKLYSKNAEKQMDTSNVKVIAGEYSSKSLSDSLDRFQLTDAITGELVKYKKTRKTWLVFAIDILHANHVCELLNKKGISAGVVHSKMPQKDQDLYMRLLKAGKIQAVVNVAKLTTGVDVPKIDLVALLRPTLSPVLHVQMIGRGLRVVYKEDMPIETDQQRLDAIKVGPKSDCLILDFAGNLERLGPINSVNLAKTNMKGTGQAPTKICPKCSEVLLFSCKICPDCGHLFLGKETITSSSSSLDVLSTKTKQTKVIYKVTFVTYIEHYKQGKPCSLKVTYRCGLLHSVDEYILLEHEGGLRTRAARWWYSNAKTKPPETVKEALGRLSELRQPQAIEVDVSGDYPIVTNKVFNE